MKDNPNPFLISTTMAESSTLPTLTFVDEIDSTAGIMSNGHVENGARSQMSYISTTMAESSTSPTLTFVDEIDSTAGVMSNGHVENGARSLMS
jgi:ATP-dependent 26S proteasome regulatory subunit